MNLREFIPEKDFDYIKNWIDDERTHVMWCAGLFAYPLGKENLIGALSDLGARWGTLLFWQ